MIKKYTFMSKSYLHKILSILYDSNGFKPYIFFCFSKLVHVPHIYIYSIGPMPKSIEYQFFGQFPKLLRQFSPYMSSLWPRHIRLAGHVRLRARTYPDLGFPAYIRGLSTPLRTLGPFSLPLHLLRWSRAL
jgi:hypothetical protein